MAKKIFLSWRGAQDRNIFFDILFVYFSFMEWNSASKHKVSSILLDCLDPFHSEFQLHGSGRQYAFLMFGTRDSFLPEQNGWEGQTSSLAVWALQAALAGVGAYGVYQTDVAVSFPFLLLHAQFFCQRVGYLCLVATFGWSSVLSALVSSADLV